MIYAHKFLKKIIFSFFTIFFLFGCGGGGGGSTLDPYSVTPEPGAQDVSVRTGEELVFTHTVTLDGEPVAFTVEDESVPSGLDFSFNGDTVTISNPSEVEGDYVVRYDVVVRGNGLPEARYTYIYNIKYTPKPDGSAGNPYEIYTEAELRAVKDDLSAHYKLMNDIKLAQGEWEAIGDYDNDKRFTGSFDGNGHVISNIEITGTKSYQGLFGYLGSRSVVSNLGISGNIAGDIYVGCIAGINDGVITNSYSMCSVKAIDHTVGGIAGWNIGEITNVYSMGSVTGNGGMVGGIAGQTSAGGTIAHTYSTASVKGNTGVGGIVGQINGGKTTNNAALMKNISATNEYGRIVGRIYFTPTIQDNYAFSGMSSNEVDWQACTDSIDGTDVDIGKGTTDAGAPQISNPAFWTALGFDPNVWDLEFDEREKYFLPLLISNMPETEPDMPAHLEKTP